MKKKYFKLCFTMLLAFHSPLTWGQIGSAGELKSIPLDETITRGKLNNGLRYFIKHLPESQDEVKLIFYVFAGINHQDPDQLNMAHFIEHMAFKSSNNFPHGIFSDILTRKSLNMSQRDVRGSSGAFFTDFEFSAPIGNQEAFQTGLHWFKDIATGLLFKDQEIENERGVLIQEFISRAPNNNLEIALSEKELLFQLVPCSQNYSNFRRHHETFDTGRLIQFYNDWYRPDLMAIVAVGNINDVHLLEKQIADQFSDIKPQEIRREPRDCDASFFNQPPQFVVVEKPNFSSKGTEKVEITMFFRDRETLEVLSNRSGIHRLTMIDLFLNILNNRFHDRTNVYNSAFDLNISHTYESSLTPSSFKVAITAHENMGKEAIKSLIHILSQIRKYGVTEEEFNQAREVKLTGLASKDTLESPFWIREIRKYLIHSEVLPKGKRRYIENWLYGLNKSEFNRFIQAMNLEMPEDIGLLSPKNSTARLFKEEEIRSLIRDANLDSVRPYVQPVAPPMLMTTKEMAKLTEKEYFDDGSDESGAHKLVLQNGVKVVFKPISASPATKKRIVLHGFSNKGALYFPAEDYFSVVNAPGFIKNSGVGNFNKFDLQQYTTTNSLYYQGIDLYINNLEAGIKLNADLSDLEKMLQLVYLFFTQPRRDSLAYQDWEAKQRNFHSRQKDSDKVNLDNNIQKIIGDYSGVSQGDERYLGLEKTDMEKGFKIYQEIFGNSQDFTFLMTGNFAVDSVTQLVNRYLGNLPSNEGSKPRTLGYDFMRTKLTGPVLVQFKSTENRSKGNSIFIPAIISSSRREFNWKENIIARALASVIDVKIRELRHKKGYSLYSVGAGAKYNGVLNRYEFISTFRCKYEEFLLLRKEFATIINQLKEELVSEELLEQALKDLRSKEDPNGRGGSLFNIHQKLYDRYRFEIPWVDQNVIMEYIETISPKDLLDASREYFKPENLYEFSIISRQEEI